MKIQNMFFIALSSWNATISGVLLAYSITLLDFWFLVIATFTGILSMLMWNMNKGIKEGYY